ncbi:unnamed protein product [Amaranthus hypochondriacus]
MVEPTKARRPGRSRKSEVQRRMPALTDSGEQPQVEENRVSDLTLRSEKSEKSTPMATPYSTGTQSTEAFMKESNGENLEEPTRQTTVNGSRAYTPSKFSIALQPPCHGSASEPKIKKHRHRQEAENQENTYGSV